MVDKSKFVNPFELTRSAQNLMKQDWPVVPSMVEVLPGVMEISQLLPITVCQTLRSNLAQNSWLAVGLDGRANNTYDEIGNYRLSNWNEDLANTLWNRLKHFLPDEFHCNTTTPTDHDGHERWRPVGVAPLFRYIRYAEGGKLVSHYDASYVESETHRTLMSLVIYLTSNERGATRFVKDPQQGLPMSYMDFSDWDRSAIDDEVLIAVKPREGNAIIFPHRILHDSEPLADGDPEKIIIRTDIIFEKVV